MPAASSAGAREEGVDDEIVVEPEIERAAEDHDQEDDALDPRHEGLLDLAREVQVSPDHHVDGREGEDRGREKLRDLRGVGPDVGREDAIEPGTEGGKESHGSSTHVLIRQLAAAGSVAQRSRPRPTALRLPRVNAVGG